MKLIFEGTPEELQEFFNAGTFIGFLDKSELEEADDEENCPKEIPDADLTKIKFLKTIADAAAKFVTEKSK